MWHLLLAVVVAAGSTGFATKHFLSPRNTVDPNAHESGSENTSPTQYGPGSRPKKGVRVQRVKQRPDAEVRSEQRKGGRRLLFRLKKRKIINKIAAKACFCSSKDNSLFGWGLGFGIMFMMSAGKAEINKLNKTMEETATLVQELSELNSRKPSCAHQMLDSVGSTDMNSHKMSGKHEVMLQSLNGELGDNYVHTWSPAINECGSSALTEEPEPPVMEMDQLEAELEFELQKLSGCTIRSPVREEIKPKLDKLEAPDEGCQGVLASELNQKLSCLLIKQQENQITELESKLNQAQSNLHMKEVELHTLKDRVRCLTELLLSTASDDETQALTDPKGTSNCGNNDMDSRSKQSVVRAKRPNDSESCSCYMWKDSNLCEHTVQGL